MIPEMITSVYLTLGTCGTRGNSQSAQFIAQQISRSQEDLQRAEFYFSIKKKVLPELQKVFSNAFENGWDGYSAESIKPDTYFQTISFLESLPNTLPAPTVGAEPDGFITLEWYKSPHRLLSISVSPLGDLHYAALIGQRKAYGTEAFDGEVPKEIVDLIHRVMLQ